MDFGKNSRERVFRDRDRASYALLVFLLLAIISGMLYFGLRPKGYRPDNNVQWAEKGPGISFNRFSIAYTGSEDFSPSQEDGFSVVFAIQPEISSRPDYRILMVVHDGDDERQLMIGQWRNWIVAMNGDDYDARRRVRRISADFAGAEDTVWVAFTSGKAGTRAYLNGNVTKTDPLLQLNWPNEGGQARMVVGNSIYGRHPWRGELSGLAVFGHALDSEGVGILFDEWQNSGMFDFSGYSGLKMLYPLSEGSGEIAYDQSGNGIHLQIPSKMHILKKEVLAPTWHLGENTSDFLLDIFLNYFGFWPLGFFLAAVLKRGRLLRKYYWQGAILLCLGFSLSIEVAQVWLPSRYSHLLDLVLNTMGGATGVLLYVKGRRVWSRWAILDGGS
jgi:VanZ family protein